MKYIIFLISCLASVYAADYVDFADVEPYQFISVELDVSEFPKVAKYFDKLSKEIESGPNFAGHFYVGFVPCGSPCQGNILIDLHTGKVTDTLTTCYGMEYKLESRLFIANPGFANEKICPEVFYEVKDSKFVEVAGNVQ